MTNHDTIRDLEQQKQLLEKLNPKFNDLTLDIQEVMANSQDPVYIAALLFKVAEERQHANKLLEAINDKFDKIMFALKTQNLNNEPAQQMQNLQNKFEILPEQDQAIVKFIEEKGSATALDIMGLMRYRGLNAASQRINKLFKEGYLKKVQSGKKVLFLAKS